MKNIKPKRSNSNLTTSVQTAEQKRSKNGIKTNKDEEMKVFTVAKNFFNST